jgi:hypothetical protein
LDVDLDVDVDVVVGVDRVESTRPKFQPGGVAFPR